MTNESTKSAGFRWWRKFQDVFGTVHQKIPCCEYGHPLAVSEFAWRRPEGCRICHLLALTPGQVMQVARTHPKQRAPSKIAQFRATVQNDSDGFDDYTDEDLPTAPPPGYEWKAKGDPIALRIIYGLEPARAIEWKGPHAKIKLRYRTATFYRQLFWRVLCTQ